MADKPRLDEIDKHILYHLGADARNTTAPTIAEQVDVTPTTVRNRIQQLESHGIIKGYSADIDYERTGDRIKAQITCTAPLNQREQLVKGALEIPGIIGARELLTGRRNVMITAVGSDSDDLSRIGEALSELGLTIEQQDTVRQEVRHSYEPFAQSEQDRPISLMDFRSLSGGAEVVEFTVNGNAEIAGYTIEGAGEAGLLDDVLVVSVERGDEVVTPEGQTQIQAGDIVTLFSRQAIPEQTVEAFNSPNKATNH